MALLNTHTRIALGVAGTTALLATKDGATAADLSDRTPFAATGMHLGAVQLQSAGVMYFSRDGTLFLADPRGAAIYAIDVGDTYRDTSRTGVEITDVDGKIAAALGTTRDQIRIVDMVAHPTSQSLYFSLTRGKGNDAVPALVRVTKADEKVTVLPLENIRNARADIPDAPTPDAKTPWGDSKRTFSVTHLALVDGELYIAGKEASTTVEMYHTSHDRYETASPIESFVAIDLGGKPSLVAGYGCSPIVTLARAELAAGKHVRGKTVAELGGGNRPFDMIRYTNAKGKEYILVANSNRTLTRLDPEQLATAKPMTSSVKQAWEPAGVGYLPVAIVGVLQLDNYNADNVVMLKRDIETGSLDVVSQTMLWL
jgi:hypothetical protein